MLSIQLNAQVPDNIASDRPGNAFSPLTVGKGVFQGQFGMDYSASSFENEEVSSYSLGTTYFRYGLSKRFEVSAQADYRYDRLRTQQNLSGISNAGIGVRYNWTNGQQGMPDIGTLLTVNFNNLLGDYETQNEVPTLLLIAQQGLSDRFAITGNLGLSLIDPDRTAIGIYVLNLGYGINDKLSAFVESYGNFDDNEIVDNYDAGLAYLLNGDVQLDFYGGVSEYRNVFNYFLSLGISIRTGNPS